MDSRQDVQQFLTALRGRITPAQAGLTVFGGERRVPGLRREEVAQLAGVSTAYYTRMERGDLSGVSDSVLFAVVRALELDDAETAHLLDLARSASGPSRPPRSKPASRLSAQVARLIDTMADVPAVALSRLADPSARMPSVVRCFRTSSLRIQHRSITRGTCFSIRGLRPSMRTGRRAPANRSPRCACSGGRTPATAR